MYRIQYLQTGVSIYINPNTTIMGQVQLEKEKELFLAAKANSDAFGGIYTHFVNDVYRFSYSILNNQHDAEDVTSQTFVEFYKKLNDFEWKDISVKYWLFTTARNIAYRKFRAPIQTSLDETVDTQDYEEITFVDEIMNKDLIEKVKEEIQKLNPVEQEIINLRIWEGLSYKEISSITDSTEEATRKKFSRSIVKLKQALEKRNIKAFAALPALFTGIFLVGANPAYAAPATLTSSTAFSSLVITKQTTMTSIKTFITSKAGIATIAGITALAVVIPTTYILANNNTNKQKDTQRETALTTPTAIPTITTTPSATPTAVATPTLLAAQTTIPTPLPATNEYAGWKTYIDPQLGIAFLYPDNFGSVKVSSYQYSATSPSYRMLSLESTVKNTVTDLPATLTIRDIRTVNTSSKEFRDFINIMGAPTNTLQYKEFTINNKKYPTQEVTYGDGGPQETCSVPSFSGITTVYAAVESKVMIELRKGFDSYCDEDKPIDKETTSTDLDTVNKIIKSITFTP
jgi:RNA polymerase sigma factor (sigma-70 family)